MEVAKQSLFKGKKKSEILDYLKSLKEKDVKWKTGKAFSYIYLADKDIQEVVKQAYMLYFSENALSPAAFPSLLQLENEVVSIMCNLLGGDEKTCGSMTSGGTESILMTLKTARKWAKKNKPKALFPEVILPATAHPAFLKGCEYFNIKPILVPVLSDFRADVTAMQQAINQNTIMLVVSAPSYPQGVIDPVEQVAKIAKHYDVLCHVDACVGGLVLPFMKDAGYPIPAFDFSIEGVTSISADLHKYGYAAKGASVILYRNEEIRKHQFFVSTDWTGGIYASSAALGSRPAGAIAAAWAALNYIGYERYVEITKQIMQTTEQIKRHVKTLEDIYVLTNPDTCIVALSSDTLNIYAVGDALKKKGWALDQQQLPPSLHVTVMPQHAATVDEFLRDLEEVVLEVKRDYLGKWKTNLQLSIIKTLQNILPEAWFKRIQEWSNKDTGVGDTPSPVMYGMIEEWRYSGSLDETVRDMLSGMYKRK